MTESSREIAARPRLGLDWLILLAGLAVQLALLSHSIRASSAAFDEGMHIAAGYRYWECGTSASTRSTLHSSSSCRLPGPPLADRSLRAALRRATDQERRAPARWLSARERAARRRPPARRTTGGSRHSPGPHGRGPPDDADVVWPTGRASGSRPHGLRAEPRGSRPARDDRRGDRPRSPRCRVERVWYAARPSIPRALLLGLALGLALASKHSGSSFP